jgi:hypothetical protein
MAKSMPDKAYLAKQASLKNFLPFLEYMIDTMGDEPRHEKQLAKLRSIKTIVEGKKK